MRFVVVRDTVKEMMHGFRTTGTIDRDKREPLIAAASEAETRRLTEERDEVKLSGPQHTHRGPVKTEWMRRTLDTETSYKKNELVKHETATLEGETEPYQETYEFTRFRPDGIEHASITILGDAVGVGGIVSMAEFVTPDGKGAWRERGNRDFIGDDLISIYNLGTY